jgi:hypothetical protein
VPKVPGGPKYPSAGFIVCKVGGLSPFARVNITAYEFPNRHRRPT